MITYRSLFAFHPLILIFLIYITINDLDQLPDTSSSPKLLPVINIFEGAGGPATHFYSVIVEITCRVLVQLPALQQRITAALAALGDVLEGAAEDVQQLRGRRVRRTQEERGE